MKAQLISSFLNQFVPFGTLFTLIYFLLLSSDSTLTITIKRCVNDHLLRYQVWKREKIITKQMISAQTIGRRTQFLKNHVRCPRLCVRNSFSNILLSLYQAETRPNINWTILLPKGIQLVKILMILSLGRSPKGSNVITRTSGNHHLDHKRCRSRRFSLYQSISLSAIKTYTRIA